MTKEILELLKKKKITQKELAARLGVSEPTLSKKMALNNWRENDLNKIAEACECRFIGKFSD